MERAEESRLMNQSPDKVILLAPLTGPVVSLADVPDPVFAGGMFGDGIAVDPLDGRLVAPCDGVVTHLARTGHAVTLQTPQGAEILLHIGIDTVELGGAGFTAKVAQGDRVRAGDLLIEFDQDVIGMKAPSLVSVIAIANSDAFDVVERASGRVTAGVTPLLSLRAKGGAIGIEAPSTPPADVKVQASRTITLVQAGGLHARPAARAREAVRGLHARVDVHHGARQANVESVVGLLGLGAGEGTTVEVIGTGRDAVQAVDAVARELLREVHGELEETPARAKSPAPRPAVRPAGMPLDPNTLAGVCAAPGIAVGKLVRWDDAEFAPPERASGTSAAESRLLDRALAAVDAELNTTVRDASQRGAVGEAGIFAVHRVLLEDPTLVDAARDLISLGKSAGFAWREAIRGQIAVLMQVEDMLLAERAADLRDIEKRVLRALGYVNPAVRALPDEAILAANEFTPSDLSSLDRARVTALVMAAGGATSHAA
ncbi:glucose PTS transporter subunit IIA, partial [Trinickia sp.]|uniref:PTS sugar transporter subunit IIA n=1 Tax=Trinickia sp. TaxID=2571163 RepID=UPI003F821A0F